MAGSGTGSGRAVAERGFTLIELLVVLSIMALLAGLVPLALWRTRAHFALRSTATTIAATLREARLRALTDGRTEAFIANLRTRAFGIVGRPGAHPLPRGIAVGLLTTTGDRLSGNRGLIRFFPDGSSTGGAVRLREGRDRLDVRVDWFTGRVVIAPGAAAGDGQ
ncbi:MAG: prepilin-type N-terminal cleavage/methylation domain-containing protein [Rhodospirillales bacterium]|jgi:general secretion pathway protein H|nr:prepilin-type N-terminal cleavage/methylation domain-containing protein [Rhodospirillales bacterium]